MTTDGDYDGNGGLHEEVQANEERMSEAGSDREVLIRLELDLAYSSEKVLNLDILLMHVADRASDNETLAVESNGISIDSAEKAIEFDILSGILDSEVKELDYFMSSLQKEILDAREKISTSEHLEMSLEDVEEKLHDAEESLKQSHDQVSEIRVQSEKFQRTSVFSVHDISGSTGNGHLYSSDAKWKMQTVEQQRHTLQMLEKSLARELDLEKRLSDARHDADEIKLKLHYAEHEAYCMEETMEAILERLFEAENSAQVLMGISKEMIGKLQVVQFNLNGSVHRESEMRYKLQQSISAEENSVQKLKTTTMNLHSLAQQGNDLKATLKEAEDKYIIANSEALALREKVNLLQEALKESNIQLQQANSSDEKSKEQQNLLNTELADMENVIADLKENIFKAESRAEGAEAKCTLLTETNLELNEELGYLKSNRTERDASLEIKLKESDAQLEHARASVEAIEEQQGMLYSALSDMEILIEDMKTRLSKAEKRADSAESKCTLLTETNLELNEELGFVRGKLQSLELSLHEAGDARIATAKDIGVKTKIITDLVMKLALERDRLQMQIFALRKENKILVKKRWKTTDDGNINGNNSKREFVFLKSSKEAVTESSTSNDKVESSATAMPTCETGTVPSTSMEDDADAESKLLPVRSIEAGQLNLKQVVMAGLALLIAVVGVYLFQLESCPF